MEEKGAGKNKRKSKQAMRAEDKETTPYSLHPTPYQISAQRWLWIGVGSFAAIIGGLWLWSLKVRFSFFSWQKASEHNLVQNSQQSWQELVNTQGQRSNRERVKNEMQEVIARLIAEAASSSADKPAIATSTTSTTIQSSTKNTP